MIINFSMKNWMSFRDEIEFTMLKGSERQHNDHIAIINRTSRKKLRLLPVSAIYGGNASGKSNFYKAFAFIQNLVSGQIKMQDMLPLPFWLEPPYRTEPTEFNLTLLANDEVYNFSFDIKCQGTISKERLSRISPDEEEILFYERTEKKITFGKEIESISEEEETITAQERLRVQFEGTNENQLFLNNIVSQNKSKNFNYLKDFRNVFEWFTKTLVIIGPNDSYQPIVDSDILSASKNLIGDFDVGFTSIELHEQEVTDESTIKFLTTFPSADNIPFSINFVGTFVKKGEKFIKLENSFVHNSCKNEQSLFKIPLESDGSRRILQLLPHLIDLTKNKNKVYIIDELDRSLHTLMVQKLLSFYLDTSSNEDRSQMIFTTHDVILMNQKWLRRDEMWVVDRDYHSNVSTMLPLNTYKNLRDDTDIRKNYLQGRLGGVPKILY